jgi:hypothetical protein
VLEGSEDHGHNGITTLIQNKKEETLLVSKRVLINGLVGRPAKLGERGDNG